MKTSKKKWIVIGIVLTVVILTLVGVVLYLDYSDSHMVVRLGKYRGLNVDAKGKRGGGRRDRGDCGQHVVRKCV